MVAVLLHLHAVGYELTPHGVLVGQGAVRHTRAVSCHCDPEYVWWLATVPPFWSPVSSISLNHCAPRMPPQHVAGVLVGMNVWSVPPITNVYRLDAGR